MDTEVPLSRLPPPLSPRSPRSPQEERQLKRLFAAAAIFALFLVTLVALLVATVARCRQEGGAGEQAETWRDGPLPPAHLAPGCAANQTQPHGVRRVARAGACACGPLSITTTQSIFSLLMERRLPDPKEGGAGGVGRRHAVASKEDGLTHRLWFVRGLRCPRAGGLGAGRHPQPARCLCVVSRWMALEGLGASGCRQRWWMRWYKSQDYAATPLTPLTHSPLTSPLSLSPQAGRHVLR